MARAAIIGGPGLLAFGDWRRGRRDFPLEPPASQLQSRAMPARYPDLQDRAAVVTGASSGIGLGIARALLAQGMRVAVHYNRSRSAADSLSAERPGRAFAIQADLGTDEGCVHLAREAVASTLPNRRLGEIDDVVNAVLYLASDASSHVLGQDLGVSGGALLVVPRGQLVPR